MSGSWAGGGWERDRGAVTPDRRLAREAVGAAAPRSTRLYVRAGGGICPSGSRHTPGAEAATALGVCRLLCGLVSLKLLTVNSSWRESLGRTLTAGVQRKRTACRPGGMTSRAT